MITKVGFVVLGHASVDDIVPEMRRNLPAHIQVLSCGALDGLSKQAISDIAPCEGDHLLVCSVEPGEEAQIAYNGAFPLVQTAIDALEADGAELSVILCGANWIGLKSMGLLVNPGAILPQLIVTLSLGKRLGIVMPTILQVESTQQKFRKMGAADAVATYITLYDEHDPTEEISRAAHFLIEENVDLVWLPCLGMGEKLRAIFQDQVKKPVVCAQTLLLKIIREIVGQPPVESALSTTVE